MQIIPFCSPGVHGLALGRLAVTVSDGIVSVSGRVECRSAIPRLVRGIQEVEGVIVVDQSIAYDIDDRYPHHAGQLLTALRAGQDRPADYSPPNFLSSSASASVSSRGTSPWASLADCT